jgi:hypothetical protein
LLPPPSTLSATFPSSPSLFAPLFFLSTFQPGGATTTTTTSIDPLFHYFAYLLSFIHLQAPSSFCPRTIDPFIQIPA